MEIQVLLSVPALTNNQALVYISPDSTRVRIEPTPRFILLETWTLGMNLGLHDNTDISPPVIYKHGIILFRSLFSLLRVLPSWKFYKRLKRKVGGVNRNGHLGIQLRVRPSGGGVETDRSILGFGESQLPKAPFLLS
jgi:autophagy-related protein 13